MEEELTLSDQEYWDNYFSDIYEEELIERMLENETESFLWGY